MLEERLAQVAAVAPLPSFRLPVGSVRQDAPSHAVALVYRSRRSMRYARRAFDIVSASLALVLALPILSLAALAIVLEDRGPILFKQRRIGRFERPFTILKLRTMFVADCADGLSPTSTLDRRITRVGRFLRRYSIDELPQFVNVIRGEMSVVGPRPEMPFVLARYEPWQHLRHLSKPGITCSWQVTHRSTIPLDRPEATLLDLEYLAHASPLVDATILVRTFLAIFRQKGAY